MAVTRKLTGRTRFRAQNRWFKEPLLVLQVEDHIFGVYSDPLTFENCSHEVDETEFRDATFSDISSPQNPTEVRIQINNPYKETHKNT